MLRRRFPSLPLSLVFALAVAFPGAKALGKTSPTPEGVWETPAGTLEIRLRKERAGGVLVKAHDQTKALAGRLVLDGTFFEDNLMAEVGLGVIVPACASTDAKAFLLLLLTKTGKLTGGVSTNEPCAEGVASVTLTRAAGALPAPVVTASAEGDALKAEALLHEGLALLQAGRFEQARTVFERAVEASPGRGEAYNGVGVTHAMRGEWREAIDWYKRGLEAQPAFADLYYNLACAYARLDKPSMALRYLKLSALKGWTQAELMLADPDLESLRELEDFLAVVALVPGASEKDAR